MTMQYPTRVTTEPVFVPDPEEREREIKEATRLANRWRKGTSPNPSGKPERQIKNLAQYAREVTGGGKDLVDFMASVLKGDLKAPTSLRMQAVNWLADRGWGKPVQQIDLDAHINNNVDLTLMTAEQLANIIELADTVAKEQKALEETIPEAEYRPIDDHTG